MDELEISIEFYLFSVMDDATCIPSMTLRKEIYTPFDSHFE